MAVLTVCSSGCDYTTIAAAVSAAGATDEIDIREDVVEQVYFSKNLARVFSSTGASWDLTTNASNISFGTGLTQLLKFEHLILDHSDGRSGPITCYAMGTGGQVEFNYCEIKATPSTGRHLVDLSAAFATGAFKFNWCYFHGDNSDCYACIEIRTTTSAGALKVTNCLLRNSNTTGTLVLGTDTTNKVITAYNNTIVDSDYGVTLHGGVDFKNNVFANNTDDLNLTLSASEADFSYCAFEEQTGPGSFGTGCIFGITSSNEFINEGSVDYHLKTGAQCIDAGTDTSETIDYDGNIRPQGSSYDIGAFEAIIEAQVMIF